MKETRFLVINGDYEYTELGLFSNTTLLDHIRDTQHSTSSQLVPHIQTLLDRNNTTLNDLDFIAANAGPGPFTTLRVILATVNGISFTRHIPLISIDSITGILTEHESSEWPATVALYNAFAKEAYYAWKESDATITTGYAPIDSLLQSLQQHHPESPIRFIGKGAQLFQSNIQEVFGSQAHIQTTIEYCSLKHMGTQALENWKKDTQKSYKLTPRYLKTPQYKKSL